MHEDMYRTPSGALYFFDGWEPGRDPVSLFDANRLLDCMHATMTALYLIGDQSQALDALADDGIIHHLLHMLEKSPTCDHRLEGWTRGELIRITEALDDKRRKT
jgi:hypothetical protein